MAKLVQKSGYIKSGKARGYMRYIATREGVEKLTGNSPVTRGQRELIQKLLHDFPDAVELFEYEDYCKTPTLGTASAFITMALDANLHEIDSESGYMQYIATRPRVQKRGAHGLFSSATAVDLASAMSELEAHEGNVWTIIYSLRREDAARLEYDSADAWRTLLMENAPALAKSMKISLNNFHWYAAFHDEGHHPHIHMMVWSDDPKEGFLTKDGIATMRSKLTNAIFRDEMQQIYERKDVAYSDLVGAAQNAMREMISRMQHQICDSPIIEDNMRQLVQALEATTGKKQYGYLKKPLKQFVDTIVDALAELPEVSECYEVWNQIHEELNECYGHSTPWERLPLSQRKEFRKISTFGTYLGAAASLRAEELTLDMFKGYAYLFIEGYLVQDHEMILHAIELAKEAGLQICLDMASYNIVANDLEFFTLLINKYVDIVFANEEEAKAFTGKEPEEALRVIAKKCSIAIVKVGANGSYIRKGTEEIKVSAISVQKVVDTTGAGDYFASGFLYGLTCGYSLDKCAKIGSILSGNVIQVIGTTIPQERWDEIKLNINRILAE